MSSLQGIKRRIKSVTSTSQITKAMELVSATKMRKSQETALRARPYAIEVLRILAEVSQRTPYQPLLMQARPVKKTAVVLIASDRGLAGPFNANVFRVFEEEIASHVKKNEDDHVFIAVGKKAEEYLTRKGFVVEASFKGFGDFITAEETEPLSELLLNGFLDEQWDSVVVLSMHFRTTLRQDVVFREVLPIRPESVRETVRELVPEYGRFSELRRTENGEITDVLKWDFEYLIEPDPKTVLDALAPELVQIAIHDLVLEANASEHSARMVAMKNASENADELKEGLNLEYNKSRQAGITREISEIVAGAEALQT